MRRFNFAAITAQIGEAQIIRHDHDEVRPFGRPVLSNQCESNQ